MAACRAGAQIERGAHGLVRAKLGEAEAFADAGVARLFVASGSGFGETRARRLALTRRVELTLATEHARDAAAAAGAHFAAGRARAARGHACHRFAGAWARGREPGRGARISPRRFPRSPRCRSRGQIYTHEGSTYGATDRADLAARAVAAGVTFMVGVAESDPRPAAFALPVVSPGLIRPGAGSGR